MKTFSEIRRDAFYTRFPGRSLLDTGSFSEQYYPEFNQDEVGAALQTIEEELVIPVGILRPEDNLMTIVSPVTTWNPIHWLRHRSIETDHLMEVQNRLLHRISASGRARIQPKSIKTLDDFIRAWCTGRSD